MTRTRNRRRRSTRPMKSARNYWFYYTACVLHYEHMMSNLGRLYARGESPL